MPDKSLSSNLLNMKFMQRGGEIPQIEQPQEIPESSAGGWAVPNAYRPKKAFSSNQVGFSDLEQPVHGRIRWKNGTKKDVLEEEEPQALEVQPDVVPKRKKSGDKQGDKQKPKSKKKKVSR